MSDFSDTIWISAGELSGDMHGASLMAALRKRNPSLSFFGMGGPHMAAQPGFTPLFRIEELSVMGVTEVLLRLPGILGLLARVKATLAEQRPRAVIVIDAPSFHFRVIKAARKLGIPVYYYISPKAWAWKEKRALFIKENVRRLISILPFEVDFYKRFGMDIDYVGNPLTDSVNWEAIKDIVPVPGRIGLLPGSREREISSLVPEFGKAAQILLAKMPHLSFSMVRAPGVAEETLRGLWPPDVPLAVEPPDDRYAFMRGCEMLIAASGTVTLEAALTGTPTIVTYKVSPITFLIGKMLVKVPYVSLSNLILGKAVFPELLQQDCDGPNLAAKALEWLRPDRLRPDRLRPDQPCPDNAPSPLDGVRRDLETLRGLMGEPGATDRAAGVILDDLSLLYPDLTRS